MNQKSTAIEYQINCSDVSNHLIEVQLTIHEPEPTGQVVQLPAWIPGSYMIRDFSKHIVSFKVFDEQGQTITWVKLNKHSWQLAPNHGSVVIQYQVYALDYSVRGAYLASDCGFFNGTSVFLQVTGQETLLHRVELLAQNRPETTGWKVATGLPALQVDTFGYGLYQAKNYASLIDYPVLIGDFQRIDFRAANTHFSVALMDGFDVDVKRLASDLSRICEHHVAMFDHPAPFEHYWFLTLLADNAFGGLEHENSTLLMSNRSALPTSTHPTEPSNDYTQFLSLCSHELFHAWLVKRIKPDVFINPDLSREAYTKQLWIYEGFTSFYDEMSLLRCGVINQENYLRLLGELVTRIGRNSGRLLQSVSESSFDAWTRFYQQDENARNAIVSYYGKGALIAICLDLFLRQQTSNSISLDDVLRRLWQQYGLTNNGTDDRVIQRICQSLGVDVEEPINQWVNGCDELPLTALLDNVGLKLNKTSSRGLLDKAGYPSHQGNRYDVGATWQADAIGVKIQTVSKDSPAAKAGLMRQDTLIAIGDWQVSASNIHSIVDRCEGAAVELTFLRRGRIYRTLLPLEAADTDHCFIEVIDKAKFESWYQAS